MKVLIVKSSHKNSNRKDAKSVFPSFLSWPPSIVHTLSYEIVRYVALNGFCPWVRRGCIACSKGRDGFQYGEGVYPDNHAQRTN